MKKILMSVAVIGFVGAIAAGATGAYFNDTEVATANVIGAGALDLKINNSNLPVTAVVNLTDLKPSFTWWTRPIKLTVSNNPGRLYKTIKPVSCETGTINQPECKAQGGSWDGTTCTNMTNVQDNLAKVTWFDLEKWIPSAAQAEPVAMDSRADVNADPMCDASHKDGCWKMGIPDKSKTKADQKDITVDSLADHPIYLGMDGTPGRDWGMIIRQSFHVMTTAGNEYQTDKCTFNEEFSVEQTNRPTPQGTLGRNGSFFDVFPEVTPNTDGSISSFFDVFTEI